MYLAHKKRGFSLTEVLLAVATLTIGMSFVSGTFVAGVYLSTVAYERTVAAVVADEAFAKIKLIGINPSDPNLSADELVPFESLNPAIPDEEFAYPSTKISSPKQYYWSALCRAIDSTPDNRLVQVTVFICRKLNGDAVYPPSGRKRPVAVAVNVAINTTAETFDVTSAGMEDSVQDGDTVVCNLGRIYRVLQSKPIKLDRPFEVSTGQLFWVVPPAENSNKNPCIAIYQKVIAF
jgi:prepilin-type N-terminal cleavage/methylation domain-containing protein